MTIYFTLQSWCHRDEQIYLDNPRETIPKNITDITVPVTEDALSLRELLFHFDDQKYSAYNTSALKFIQVSQHKFFTKHNYLDWDKMPQKRTKDDKILYPPYSADDIYTIMGKKGIISKSNGLNSILSYFQTGPRSCRNFERRINSHCDT